MSPGSQLEGGATRLSSVVSAVAILLTGAELGGCSSATECNLHPCGLIEIAGPDAGVDAGDGADAAAPDGGADPDGGDVITALAAGGAHTCAIVNGGAYCWGYNSDGECGDGTTEVRLEPVPVKGLGSGVSAITAGENHTCAIVDGGAFCWGYNGSGQLGNSATCLGSASCNSAPAPVTGLWAGVTAIAAGADHTCAVMAGSAWCWGDDTAGQLGDQGSGITAVPVQVKGLVGPVLAVAAGYDFSCAVVGGVAWCWGNGDLGNGTSGPSLVPVQVAGLSNVSAIAARYRHACAIANGALACWGDNAYGDLGDGSPNGALSPVTPVGMTNGITAVAAGDNHTCAIANGQDWCWGYNGNGQLGNFTTTNSSTRVAPSELPAGQTFFVAAGGTHSCGATSGTIWCWGGDAEGQIGANIVAAVVSIPTPVTESW